MENPFAQEEQLNGTRWTWTVLPATKSEAQNMIIPVGCMYTPLKQIDDMPVLPYDPVICKSCRAILNPYWFVR